MGLPIIKTGLNSAAPVTIPVSYLGMYQHLDMAAKVGGFVVIVLQGVFVTIQILRALRNRNRDEKDS